jgi:hypothetical protein
MRYTARQIRYHIPTTSSLSIDDSLFVSLPLLSGYIVIIHFRVLVVFLEAHRVGERV